MSAKNLKPESARSRAIFEKCNRADVVAGDEDGVTGVYPLHIVKDNPLAVFDAELESARAGGGAIAAAVRDSLNFPGVMRALAECDSSVERALCALKKARKR
jgi:hypothetical protein